MGLLLAGGVCCCAATGFPARSSDDRAAWAADLARRGDLGRETLEELGRRGFFEARLCADSGGVARLEPGPSLAGYRLVWSGSGHPADEGLQPWPRRGSPAEPVARAIERVLAEWGDAGRPFGLVRVAGYGADSVLTLRLAARPGPHLRVTGVRFQFAAHGATRESYLRRVVGWRGEEVWRTRRWTVAREALLATGLFDAVDGPWLLKPAGVSAWPDSARAELLLRLTERRVSRFSGLLGYSGQTESFSGFFDLELGNLFGTGRRARMLWQGQQDRESRFELAWREPYVWVLPLAVEGELTHVLQDTLYAETRWGADLTLALGPRWSARAGWGWGRLVLGGPAGETRRRTTARFAIARRESDASSAPSWGGMLELAGTGEGDRTLRSLRLDTAARFALGPAWLRLEHTGALLAGSDSLLLVDALPLGGAQSLRGWFESAWRTERYVVQRLEVGPRPQPGGPRFYLLGDLGWLREWRPHATGLTGSGGGSRWLWSAGLGVQTPTRAGDLRLDYAVPEGAAVWNGRIHFGVATHF